MAMYYYATKLSMVACVAGCRQPRRRRSHSATKQHHPVDNDDGKNNSANADNGAIGPLRKVSNFSSAQLCCLFWSVCPRVCLSYPSYVVAGLCIHAPAAS